MGVPSLFKITPDRWYGWQMMPGYVDFYYSPIFVWAATPRTTGRSALTVTFLNAFYAQGVQEFEKTLHVLYRGANFLLADIDSDRAVVVNELTMGWLQHHCASLFTRHELLRTETDPQRVLGIAIGTPSR
jgi:hypothetical protein